MSHLLSQTPPSFCYSAAICWDNPLIALSMAVFVLSAKFKPPQWDSTVAKQVDVIVASAGSVCLALIFNIVSQPLTHGGTPSPSCSFSQPGLGWRWMEGVVWAVGVLAHTLYCLQSRRDLKCFFVFSDCQWRSPGTYLLSPCISRCVPLFSPYSELFNIRDIIVFTKILLSNKSLGVSLLALSTVVETSHIFMSVALTIG